jgi:hypothetical protein
MDSNNQTTKWRKNVPSNKKTNLGLKFMVEWFGLEVKKNTDLSSSKYF